MSADPGRLVLFFDEGRFGLHPGVGRRWAKKGERPVAVVKTGYENFYAYSAVCPATGEHVSLFLPRVNTEMMNIFLGHLAASLGERRCLLILDQAGWHGSNGLVVPPNIELAYLPPYSPELNPVERLWDWLKRNCIRNRFYQKLDEIMDALQECLMGASPGFLKGLCGCNYLLR